MSSPLTKLNCLFRRFYKYSHIKFMVNFILALVPGIIYIYIYVNFRYLKEFFSDVASIQADTTFLPMADNALFGCLPHKLISAYSHPILDMAAGIPYLMHFFLPIIESFYILQTTNDTTKIYKLLWCGGWVNIAAVIIQFFFPTAPPWFVEISNTRDASVVFSIGNEAALGRVDKMLGITTFNRIFSSGTVIFGALPSLHVAWPVVIFHIHPFYSRQFTIFYITWISWAAMYSLHHYAVDIAVAIIIVIVVHFLAIRTWCPFKHR